MYSPGICDCIANERFSFTFGQKKVLKQIADHFTKLGLSGFTKNVLCNDPLAELYLAYNKVIEDCESFPFLKAMLQYKQSRQIPYPDVLRQIGN